MMTRLRLEKLQPKLTYLLCMYYHLDGKKFVIFIIDQSLNKKTMENLHKTWMENWRKYGSYNNLEDPIFFFEKSMVSKLFLILKNVADDYSD